MINYNPLHPRYNPPLKRSPRLLYIMLTIKQINSAVDQRVQIRGRLVINPALYSFSSYKTKKKRKTTTPLYFKIYIFYVVFYLAKIKEISNLFYCFKICVFSMYSTFKYFVSCEHQLSTPKKTYSKI